MSDPGAEPPAIRASDAEREAVVARLRTAAGEGRLALDELAERLDRAFAAVTRSDLEPLTRDLPEQDPDARPSAKSRRWVVGIMGGGTQKGRWRIAPQCTVLNVMGGADLDLTGAIVSGPETEIRVFSLMGGSDIVVPDGVHVEMSGFALMGANDCGSRTGLLPRPAPRWCACGRGRSWAAPTSSACAVADSQPRSRDRTLRVPRSRTARIE